MNFNLRLGDLSYIIMSGKKTAKKTKTPRVIATANKKKRIYNEALRLFKKYGYNNVTVKDIATAAGMTEGSVFYFYGSKADIIAGFYDKMFEDASVYFILNDENLDDPYNAILKAFYTHGECFSGIGAELTAMYYNNYPEDYAGVVNIKDAGEAVAYLYRPFYEFVLAAVERGTLKLKVTPEDFTSMVYTFCNGLVLVWTRSNGCFDLMELSKPRIRILLDLLTGGDEQQ